MTTPAGAPVRWWRRLFGRDESRVDPAPARAMQGEGAVLLDVRERTEWTAGHAPKARHIPAGKLASRSGELPRGTTVLTICRSGARSARAAAELRRGGFTVLDVRDGMRAWEAAGLPLVAAGGRPGRVA